MPDRQRDLNLGLIGNCVYGALIDSRAEVVWACLPRFDEEPVFSSLLKIDDSENITGTFSIDLIDFSYSEQYYEKNTAILVTRLRDKHDNAITITDFAPRFTLYGRIHRPVTLMRKLEPEGAPRLRVRLRPAAAKGDGECEKSQGSNHVRYTSPHYSFRLTTTLSVTAIMDETMFVMTNVHYMIFGLDKPITESISHITERFLIETRHHWLEWCRSLAIPFEWQDAVIRAAITLKLSTYEDTGAIVAAITTSIPESENSGRNWDYRFCWLRDSYFTVQALNRLGTTRTMEQFLQYIVDIVSGMKDCYLQPVYRINGRPEMEESQSETLAGYRGMGPVRFGNEAAPQIQHDVYGAVILAVAQMFFDERIYRHGDEALFRTLEKIGEKAKSCYNQPDAGLWELRTKQHIHTFSSMMCWAAADRLARIAKSLDLSERQVYWREVAETIHEEIDQRAFNKQMNSYTAIWDGQTMDASLLLACELGFVSGDDPKFIGTVKCVEKYLRPSDSRYLFRYVEHDDFGQPENAFTICSFWYIDALAMVGRRKEARELFELLLERRNHLGLLSEDIHPVTGELWGNFPQTYSMVGLINSARLLSKHWEAAF